MALAIRLPNRGHSTHESHPMPVPRPTRSAVAAATRSTLIGLARLVRLAALGVAGLIALAIILRVLGANASNSIVSDVHDGARALAGPFRNMFTFRHAEAAMAVNWGMAAVVYLIAGSFIARRLARTASRAR